MYNVCANGTCTCTCTRIVYMYLHKCIPLAPHHRISTSALCIAVAPWQPYHHTWRVSIHVHVYMYVCLPTNLEEFKPASSDGRGSGTCTCAHVIWELLNAKKASQLLSNVDTNSISPHEDTQRSCVATHLCTHTEVQYYDM